MRNINIFINELMELYPHINLFIALATAISILYGVYKFVKKHILKFSKPLKKYCRTINQLCSKEQRKEILKYYINTRAQDIDPCNSCEPIDNSGKFLSVPLVSFLQNSAFASSSHGQYYLILADSGMGKTTFLLKLYQRCTLSFIFKRKKHIELIPLADPHCLEIARNLPQPEDTVLLLDGFDENIEAMENLDLFWQQLINATMAYNKIVITCRTQFFPDFSHEPTNTGLIQVGGPTKGREIVKKYISPFDDNDIQKYLKKRFRFNKALRGKAWNIIHKVPDIMARPIILNWITFLCDSEESYKYTYQIYDTIIEKWIEREDLGGNSEKLFNLSIEVSRYMYKNNVTLIPAEKIDTIARSHNVDLKPIIAKSRSLLNRNSGGEYKFAHRSFLEYFLIVDIFRERRVPSNTDFLFSLTGVREFIAELLLDRAEKTDSHQISANCKKLSQNIQNKISSDLLDFMLNSRVKVNAKNTKEGFTVEFWLYSISTVRYEKEPIFDVGNFFSSTSGAIHEVIENNGVDVGLIFYVKGDKCPPQVIIDVLTQQKDIFVPCEEPFTLISR